MEMSGGFVVVLAVTRSRMCIRCEGECSIGLYRMILVDFLGKLNVFTRKKELVELMIINFFNLSINNLDLKTNVI